MATIHHATVKSAASKGVTLTVEGEDGIAVAATSGERTFVLDVEFDDEQPTGPELTERAKDAWTLLTNVLAFEADHPGVQIEQEDEDFVAVRTEDGEEIARDPDIDDLFQSVDEALAEGTDETEEDDEEEDNRASVVPHSYKRRYADAGHPNTCGDWLASQLNGECLGDDGFNLELFREICDANGVDIRKYTARKTRGWQGRARMTGRNVLGTAVVRANGILHVPAMNGHDDLELQAPADWLAAKTPKARGKAAVEV